MASSKNLDNEYKLNRIVSLIKHALPDENRETIAQIVKGNKELFLKIDRQNTINSWKNHHGVRPVNAPGALRNMAVAKYKSLKNSSVGGRRNRKTRRNRRNKKRNTRRFK